MIDELLLQDRHLGVLEKDFYVYIGDNFGVGRGPMHLLAPPLNEEEIAEVHAIYPATRDLSINQLWREHNGCKLFFGQIVLLGFWYLRSPRYKMKANITFDIGAINKTEGQLRKRLGAEIIGLTAVGGLECMILENEDREIVSVTRSTGQEQQRWVDIGSSLEELVFIARSNLAEGN